MAVWHLCSSVNLHLSVVEMWGMCVGGGASETSSMVIKASDCEEIVSLLMRRTARTRRMKNTNVIIRLVIGCDHVTQ